MEALTSDGHVWGLIFRYLGMRLAWNIAKDVFESGHVGGIHLGMFPKAGGRCARQALPYLSDRRSIA